MTSPHLADLIKAVDPVDALRLLVTDLQALANRLKLKEQSRSLKQTLKETQERVFGPRTVVMLLSENAASKRRFLERLLGPELAAVPQPSNGCLRLEHGAEAECTVTMPQGLTAVLPLEHLPNFLARRGVEMPQQNMQSVRLPNATLARGLAVIDTPVIDGREPAGCVLAAAEQADAWIFVLDTDHSLSEASLALLRQLPERATRLDMVVEGAEDLSGEARLAARKRLVATLRESCNVAEPRLTLLASPAGEGEEGSFWHGRFATFQSVLMLRGRERWLEATRVVVAAALADVGMEMEFELKGMNLGLRQARLRLAQRDLDGLRARFHALALLDSEHPRENAPSLVSAVLWPEPEAHPPVAPPTPTAPQPSPVTETPPALLPPSDALQGASAEESIPSAPMGEVTFVGFRGETAVSAPSSTLRQSLPHTPPAKRSVSVKLSSSLARLLRPSDVAGKDGITLPARIAGYGIVAVILCAVLWVVWPRPLLAPQEPAAQWDYDGSQRHAGGMVRPPPGASATGSASVMTGATATLPAPIDANAGADTTSSETPTDPGAPTPTKPGATVRTPLPRGASSSTYPGHARRRRRGFLGLGRVWHWIRRDNNKRRER